MFVRPEFHDADSDYSIDLNPFSGIFPCVDLWCSVLFNVSAERGDAVEFIRYIKSLIKWLGVTVATYLTVIFGGCDLAASIAPNCRVSIATGASSVWELLSLTPHAAVGGIVLAMVIHYIGWYRADEKSAAEFRKKLRDERAKKAKTPGPTVRRVR